MRAWTLAPRLPSPASSPAPLRIPMCSRCSSSGAAPGGMPLRTRTLTSVSCSGGRRAPTSTGRRSGSSTWPRETWTWRSSSRCPFTSGAGSSRKARSSTRGTRRPSMPSPSARRGPGRASATFIASTSTRSCVVDRDRVLAKLDELEGYLGELRVVAPDRFEGYQRTETKRACERLIQVSVEAVIDICALLVVGLRLGLPGEEDDLFERLSRHGTVSGPMAATLRHMKGLRNLLVHEYRRINDELVFEAVHGRLGDFDAFKGEVLAFLKR